MQSPNINEIKAAQLVFLKENLQPRIHHTVDLYGGLKPHERECLRHSETIYPKRLNQINQR